MESAEKVLKSSRRGTSSTLRTPQEPNQPDTPAYYITSVSQETTLGYRPPLHKVPAPARARGCVERSEDGK